MAPRVFWKGYLKLSLVTCRVTMTPAVTESRKIRFHNVNRRTGNRVQSDYIDAATGKPVDDDDQRRGYEYEDGKFVLFTDDELAEVALESTRTIDIAKFVDIDSIDWIWFDSPHYLAPADKVSQEAFSVIREAMSKTGTGAISRIVLYRREHPVLILPRDRGMIAWTLRYGDEVRAVDQVDAPAFGKRPAPKMLGMMTDLIESQRQTWSPDLVKDPVEKKLRSIINARKKSGKAKSEPAKKPETGPRGDNVIDIMSALKRSLESEKKGSKAKR
ncbi:Ku protein [Ciceribacter sp. L1K22]|uniref:non-homologous end joining protein Ku n=1 Tax=Ciceribacter sp. L1K22 TaxID=2820275 RepID=UPI001ABED6E2|nr:Ku protein [Ciceribacter sp. L1K22]MBO3762201.1 Ku protein [Ciceribacter sp. L1K22]